MQKDLYGSPAHGQCEGFVIVYEEDLKYTDYEVRKVHFKSTYAVWLRILLVVDATHGTGLASFPMVLPSYLSTTKSPAARGAGGAFFLNRPVQTMPIEECQCVSMGPDQSASPELQGFKGGRRDSSVSQVGIQAFRRCR